MPFPIVLAQGIARFDVLTEKLKKLFSPGADADGLHYFRNIKTFLESNGYVVFHSNVSFAGSVEKRAQELATQIDDIVKNGPQKVHIIGHSMGGLDARHMIVDLPTMVDKVASLTTIGTPHLGTVFADRALEHGGNELVRAFRNILDLQGFQDLSTARCDAFNQRAMEAEATNPVVYQTYASHEKKSRVLPFLWPSWDIINESKGESDGLVPVESQEWRAELTASNGARKAVRQKQFPVPADHLNQVGWWDPGDGLFDRAAYEASIKNVYLEIAQSAG